MYKLIVIADVTDVTLSTFAKACDVEVSPVSLMPQMAALTGSIENIGMVAEIFFNDPYLILEARKCHYSN